MLKCLFTDDDEILRDVNKQCYNYHFLRFTFLAVFFFNTQHDR